MQIAETRTALSAARQTLAGTVGFVPTMGALHEGHLALVDAAKSENDHVIASIFVNPTQFSPQEDLSKYPRSLARDLALLESAGADVVFTPSVETMYPAGYQTYIDVEHVAQGLEGARRPGHFRGVATIVAKLFNMTQPNRAYFGQKDAQQVVVVRRMVYDLNFPVSVEIIPTMREEDGLAMSSRNVYLTAEERLAARSIYQALAQAGDAYHSGERSPDVLRTVVVQTLAAQPSAMLRYVSIADARTLEEQHALITQPVLLSLAAQIGMPTLIDNIVLPLALNTRDGLTQILGKL